MQYLPVLCKISLYSVNLHRHVYSHVISGFPNKTSLHNLDIKLLEKYTIFVKLVYELEFVFDHLAGNMKRKTIASNADGLKHTQKSVFLKFIAPNRFFNNSGIFFQTDSLYVRG